VGTLGAAQLFAGGAPLVITLYAAAVLPPQRYAAIAALESATAFCTVAVLYSFEITGAAAISRLTLRAHARAIGTAIGEVLASRIAIWIAVSCAFLGVALAFGGGVATPAAWLLVALSNATQLGWACVPLGIPGVYAAITVATRALSIGLALTLLDGEAPPALVPLLIAVPALAGNLVTLLHLRARYGIPVLLTRDVARIYGKIKEDADYFVGNLGITLFRDANPAVLALLGLPAEAIMHYSVMEKTNNALQNIVRPINQHFYRTMARYIHRLRSNARALYCGLLRRSTLQASLYVLASTVALAALIALARVSKIPELSSVVAVATGDPFSFAVLLVAPIVGVFNYWLGVVGLAIRGQKRAFVRVCVATGGTGLLMTSILSLQFSYVGACISFTCAEFVFFALASLSYVSRRRSPARA
jgi:hypothetical protein